MMRRSNETAIISSTAEGKRPKGRPKGSKNKPKPALLASSVSVSDHMAPYLLQVPHGNDVVQAISQFSRRKNIGICVLSASGTVFNAAVRSSAALPAPDVTCPDRYLILSISAAFLPHQSLTSPTALKPLTVSLVAPSGHVVGGLVSGQLLAAGPVFVIATSFNNPIHYTLQSNEEDDAQNTAVASGGESEHAPPPNPLSDGMALYYNHHDSLQLPFAQWALGSNNGLKMIDFARAQKELVECGKDAEGSGITVVPKADNLARLIGTIPGPVGTPYEGGIFQIDITLPAQLSKNHYARTCPNLENIVRDVVRNKFQQTFVTVPATLRLFFHDCFVQGCDGSVMVASTGNNKTEKDHANNLAMALCHRQPLTTTFGIVNLIIEVAVP